jgi:type II secretory pathway predicted ATPase ExeA/cell division protein FtsN
MYCDFFGFSENPFEITPDLKFLYLGPRHQEALDSLVSGIRERLGLIVLTGTAGVGKGTLLRAATARLGEKDKLVQIVSNDLPFDYLLTMALVELGASRPEEDLTGTEVIDRLKHYAEKQFANNGNLVFVIKDAQNLDNEAIHSLQHLSDSEIHGTKLIQVILSGTPELEANFGQLELGTFTDSINLRLHIYPLTERETYKYISHRLAIANLNEPELFDRGALRMIWEYAGGVPEKINVLCDTALRIGYGIGKKEIEAGIVEQAVADLGWEPFSEDFEFSTAVPIEEYEERSAETRRPYLLLGLGGSLVVALFIVIAAWLFWGGSETNRRLGESNRVSEGTRAEVKGKSDSAAESAALVRQRIEVKGDQETEVASIGNEMADTVTSSEAEMMVENQESIDLLPVGNREASEEDLEVFPGREGETVIAEATTALPTKEKPPVTSADTDSVQESFDSKVKTAGTPRSVTKPQGAVTGKVIFQLGAFREKRNAEDLKRKLEAKGYDAYLVEAGAKEKGIRYRVRVRCCSNAAEERAVKAQLNEQGFGDAFIVARKKDSGKKGD